MSPKGGFICSLKPVQIYSPVLPNLESEWMVFGEGEGCWRGVVDVGGLLLSTHLTLAYP